MLIWEIRYGHLDRLIGLSSPVKYEHLIRIKIEGADFTFHSYVRDGYDCVSVRVDAYYPVNFLLRSDGKQLWAGDTGVFIGKITKEIDGITYHADIDRPTVWTPLVISNKKIEQDLMYITILY